MRQGKARHYHFSQIAGHLTRIVGAAGLVALCAACTTADRARYAGAAQPQLPSNPAEVCVSPTKVAELEREIEGLKAENTALIGRVLGINNAEAGKGERVSAGQSGQKVLREESAAVTQPQQPAAVGASDVTAGGVLYGAHLASYRGLSGVQAGWRKLRLENPEELAGLDARVKKITVPQKGEFLRLISGPFSSRSEAAKLCSTLETRNLSCRVVNFEGVPFIAGGAREFENLPTQ